MLGKLIRNSRRKKRKRLEDVAMEAGIDKGYLSNIENDKRKPTIKVLKEVCNAIGVPYQKFLACYDTYLPKAVEDYNFFTHTAEERILVIDDINDLHFLPCPASAASASFAIRINDDALNIEKYSYVFIDLGTPVKPNDVGLFYLNGKIFIRRLYVYKGDYFSLYADNPKYPKIKVNDDDIFYIIGKVIQ